MRTNLISKELEFAQNEIKEALEFYLELSNADTKNQKNLSGHIREIIYYLKDIANSFPNDYYF